MTEPADPRVPAMLASAAEPPAAVLPASSGGPGGDAPSAAAAGRDALAAWLEAQPVDLYADDADLAALVAHHRLSARIPALRAAGRAVAGPLDAAARENDLPRNHPVLDAWDGIGRHTAGVAHHPTYGAAGRAIYGTGIMAAYGEVGVDGRARGGAPRRPVTAAPHRFILSLFYLTAQAGEAGHNCPLACDAGAIRTLQHLGTAEQQTAFLPGLLDPDFDTNMTASQFLTEVQGGSDVGANAVRATPVGEHDGGAGSAWSISGEKWFCSNADADVFLLTARVADPATGTKGLGLFLVPRALPDGSVNGFRIRRLKEKLGTRSMASGEIDFTDARATALGPVRDGFKHVMELVITTSRLFNAAGCAAHARRAWVVASTYAQHRTAFGQPIGQFPLVAETLAWIRADAVACLASTLMLAGLQEELDDGSISETDAAFFRVAVNLNKLQTSVMAHDAVNRGIEVLGGNGAIESFSVLPRLLRDNVVYENWEGSHNVLRAQVLRDCARMGVHVGFFDALAARLGGAHAEALAADRAALEALLEAPGAVRDLGFRRLGARMAIWVMVAAMAPVPALDDARFLVMRHLAELPIDDAYLGAVAALQR
ncbi:MAG: acyl-CoA dehydrogenase family protein [Candidatus Nanopelagicales bacterium]|nr:acyl-CoA dehydrogenase family protein [Candidatus Nanopelagicales bacterium]